MLAMSGKNMTQWKSRLLGPRLRLLELASGTACDQASIRRELERLAMLVDREQLNLAVARDCSADLSKYHFDLVPADLTGRLHRVCHYLGGPRADGLNLGLWPNRASEWPVCVVSFVSFDLDHIAPYLPFGISPEQVMILARQVTLGSIPENAWSYTLRRAAAWIRESRPEIRMLLTYVDPNLGFNGATYRAANWALFGTEAKGRYVFVDGEHCTNRELIRQYGTARYDDLETVLGERISRTTCALQPLNIYVFFTRRRDRRQAPTNFDLSFGMLR